MGGVCVCGGGGGGEGVRNRGVNKWMQKCNSYYELLL